jgi:hypothetical protein
MTYARFKVTLWLLFIGLMFTGCASAPAVVTVDIPVAVNCAADASERPIFPDTPAAIHAAANIEARTNLILAGRLLRDKRIDNLEAAISGCEKPRSLSEAAPVPATPPSSSGALRRGLSFLGL